MADLTIPELAELFGASEYCFRDAIADESLPAYRTLGQDWKVREDVVARLQCVAVGPRQKAHIIVLPPDGVRYISDVEYAAQHGMTQRAVRRYLNLGHIKGVKLPGKRSWLVEVVDG